MFYHRISCALCFLSVTFRCSLYLLQLCRHIHTSRSSLFFQSSRYCKDLECYVETLGQLVACLTYLKHLMAYCNDGELFMNEDNVVGDSLLLQLEMINIDCFYGRCLGFQVVFLFLNIYNMNSLKSNNISGIGLAKIKTTDQILIFKFEPRHEKPVYAVCEQQRHRSACASVQSDQHLCCSLTR